MKRIQSLHRFQKAVLALTAAMMLLFTAVYLMAASRKGFLYQNALLIPQQADGRTFYIGKIQGEPACFAVEADKTVTFQYSDRTYGPYTVRENPAAIPQNSEMRTQMTGVELYCGEKLLFYGGITDHSGRLLLYHTDGSLADAGISVTVNGGAENMITMDGSGNGIDPMEPSAYTILDLMTGPKLTHKGAWPLWAGGILICAATMVSVLFADELFRFNLAFRIRDADRAEPSEWEIAGRYISWAVLPVVALALFIGGLQ